MAHFTHLIFDLDGTLVDSKPGLLNALKYVCRQMGVEVDEEKYIDKLIGPPVQQGLKEILGFSDRQIEMSVRLFREYYGQKGYREGELYPGVLLLLEELVASGKRLYLATSKSKLFLPEILRHFSLDQYFDDVEAAEPLGTHTKAELITNLMDRNRLVPSSGIVMIGDTKFDIVGGKANEIATIAVGYGFGETLEIQELEPDYFAEDLDELAEILLG